MFQALRQIVPVPMALLMLVPQAATVSRQSADSFSRKVALVRQHSLEGNGARRTAFSQNEVNSWFTYASQTVLPAGVTQPQVSILGDGRLAATAVVDLDEVSRRRSSGSRLDPWNLLGGRVPLNVTGILHTRDGVGRIELQSADISGVPVPTTVVQELVAYYSRTQTRPQGVRLEDPFNLPSKIRQIEVGQGQAVIVQ